MADSDLVERGVEVLRRLSVSKVSLSDASFIAQWVSEARAALRAPTSLEAFGIDAVDLDMIRSGDMLGPALGEKVFSALIALRTQPEGRDGAVQDERIKLHRKVMGMIADKQRYVSALLSGRELHVIAEALLDRTIAVERTPPAGEGVTVW